ncbi:thiosulfate oxidation carrier protein SoxY [Roseospira marina]|uniref:Thiosulfate oxidation carrier protein SoxY n=1 Tax=Roseospira marina TaxID=140057 RepID=A0A5M6IEE5_9PROT|nr:thiosulfate oxidation carrier protein SoxY [Roseospira marina]KAA5606656.1 thiosulfate oxidation carrier protein SoxY [Roseospira marina]MBB4313936.1 sulfur-oxidizing protein SoxY [Roseospira marina]MBB5087098.1 sulfur-oxidizing protein SoxY [Roseospira marina]
MQVNIEDGGIRRRSVLFSLGGGAAVVAGLTVIPGLANADEAAVTEAIKGMVGDVPDESGVALDLPEIAENGNTVPLSFTVDAPMGEDLYVKDVMVMADGNPSPDVAVFHFTPMSGVAAGSTRMRLAGTQNVVAVARLSDGTALMGSKQVKVTIGGCGG